MLKRKAGFPILKTLQDYDFEFAQGVLKKQIEELSKLTFLQKNENVIFLGASGVGKTHLTISLGEKTIQAGIKTRFVSAADLSVSLENNQKEGRCKQVLQSFISPRLLIIDEI